MIYTTKYEKDPKARKEAIKIHGLSCMVCGINFEKVFGPLGKEFIHVHHNKPLFSRDGIQEVNPATDLDEPCRNCHSMIHRNKSKLLTKDELRFLLKN